MSTKKRQSTRTPGSAPKNNPPPTLDPPGHATVLYQYCGPKRGTKEWMSRRRSKRDCQDEFDVEFRGAARSVGATEHPQWHGWFFLIAVEVSAPQMPSEPSRPGPLLTMDRKTITSSEELLSWASVVFDQVPEHFRCPLCWDNGKGKPLRRDQTHDKGALRRYYLKCDACGTEWHSDVRRTVELVDQRVKEKPDASVGPEG